VWWRNSKSPLKLDSESKDNRIRKLIRGRRQRHSPVSVSEGERLVKMQIAKVKWQNCIGFHICHLPFDL
jgi:hypothetical protein